MSAFEFASVGRIIFGQGKIAQLGELARGLGSVALMIHNGDDPGRRGPVDRAAASLTASGISVHYHRQRGEPTIAHVDAALATARQNRCDLVIGIGGGSAIDAAKAVAGLITNGGAAIDYMEVIGKGRKITKLAAPWIAVPTTAGTGAEVTKNAVIGSPEHKFKASIRGDQLLARIALVDPELGINVPPDVTAASGMDALCQLIESYTSQGANDLTGPLSIEGIALVTETLPRAYADGTVVEAREDMAFAALLGGITLTNAGLGAVHGFAAPLGAHFPMPHGVICGVLLPHVMRANVAALRAEQSPWISNYADVGRALASNAALPDEDAIEIGPGCVDRLVAELALPRLSKYGLQESHIAEIVALAKKTSSMRYNPVALSDEALGGVLRSAL